MIAKALKLETEGAKDSVLTDLPERAVPYVNATKK